MAPSIDWQNLGFKYTRTDSHVWCEYKNGSWGELQVQTEPVMQLHIAATCLHYGQACFEGLKAFRRADGSIAVFRPEENARRLIATAQRMVMEPPPEEVFLDAVQKVIELNREWVPPYGTGASLYLRPLLIGSSAHVGLHASEDYIFLVLCMPVGPYYKTGFFPVNAIVQERFDRAAPRGVGNVKAAGNYAAGMAGDLDGKARGYPICLYLDSATHQFVDEFGTSNFLAITADKRYVTPESSSILPSITNKSLQVIAQDFGMKVEKRAVSISELAEFKEVGACGTAAVITPVHSITLRDTVYTYGEKDLAGDVLTRLYKEIQGIQYGEIDDRHGWMLPID